MGKEEILTIGVEEEYQIVDPVTRELSSFVSEYLEEGAMIYRDQVQPELLQSQIEIGSKVCGDIQELERNLSHLRLLVKKYANKSGLEIVAAGTHPFSHWKNQIVTQIIQSSELYRAEEYHQNYLNKNNISSCGL